MRTLLRSALVLALASLAGCSAGNTQCTGGEDAGAGPRTFGEPCGDDVSVCDQGMTCANVSIGSVQRQCVKPCGDGGACGGGTACLSGNCVPLCSTPTDCPGRFVSTCRATDAGVGLCLATSCGAGSSCPSGTCVKSATSCCPPGAPCVAPPPGVCVR